MPNAMALLVYQFAPEGQKPRILLTPGFSFVLLGSSLTMARHEKLLYSGHKTPGALFVVLFLMRRRFCASVNRYVFIHFMCLFSNPREEE